MNGTVNYTKIRFRIIFSNRNLIKISIIVYTIFKIFMRYYLLIHFKLVNYNITSYHFKLLSYILL